MKLQDPRGDVEPNQGRENKVAQVWSTEYLVLQVTSVLAAFGDHVTQTLTTEQAAPHGLYLLWVCTPEVNAGWRRTASMKHDKQ